MCLSAWIPADCTVTAPTIASAPLPLCILYLVGRVVEVEVNLPLYQNPTVIQVWHFHAHT